MRIIDLFESDEPVLEADLLANGDAELVYHGPNIEIIKINSLKAGQFYSAGTEWIFARSNASFDQASKSCPIYFIRSLIPGVPKRIIHCGNSKQFFDTFPVSDSIYFRDPSNDCLSAEEYRKILAYIPPFLLKLLIMSNPSWIRFLENPTIDIQLISVQKNGRNIQYIDSPTPMIQSAACRQDAELINLIKPVESIDKGLLKKHKLVLDRPRREYLFAIEAEENKLTESKHFDPNDISTWSDGSIFGQIKLLLTSGNGPYDQARDFLAKVNNISPSLMKRLVKTDGWLIEELQTLFPEKVTEEIRELAIKNRPDSISFIDNPSISLQLLAVNLDGLSIGDIRAPSPMIQSAACRQNPNAINFISEKCRDPGLAEKYKDYLK